MDRKKCGEIRREIDAALEVLGKRLGLSIKTVGGGTFSSTNLTLKVEAAELGDGGAVLSREAQAYQLMAPLHGIPASTLGWTFKQGRKTFTVRGWNNKAHSMPILCDCDGRGYKFPVNTVVGMLATQHKAEWAAAIAEDNERRGVKRPEAS
jgi:hypothetical protein